MAGNGVFHPSKLGRGVKKNGVLYMLIGNSFYEDIETSLKEVVDDGFTIEHVKKQAKQTSGYILKLERDGKSIAIPYYAKKP